jgi:hypothetical protein
VKGANSKGSKGMKHPFGRALYEQDGQGNVLVTQPDGTWGRFRTDGSWIDGELRECDPHLAGWIGGPMVTHHRVQVED